MNGWQVSLIFSALVVAAGAGLLVFLWHGAADRAQAWGCALVGTLCGGLWLAPVIPLGRRIIGDCRKLMREVLLDGGLLLNVLAEDAYARYPQLGKYRLAYWPAWSLLGSDRRSMKLELGWRIDHSSFHLRIRDLIISYPLVCRSARHPVLPRRWQYFAYWLTTPLLLVFIGGIVYAKLAGPQPTFSIATHPWVLAPLALLVLCIALATLLSHLPEHALRLAICDALQGYYGQDEQAAAGANGEDGAGAVLNQATPAAEAASDAAVQARRAGGAGKADSLDDTGWS